MRFEERTRMCRDAGINPDTAQNNAWVVRRFDASQGREKLKFGHYAAVMGLPPAEADKLLYLATRGKMWSVQTLRTAVDQEKARPRRKELVQERAPCARSVVSPVKPEPRDCQAGGSVVRTTMVQGARLTPETTPDRLIELKTKTLQRAQTAVRDLNPRELVLFCSWFLRYSAGVDTSDTRTR